MILLVAIIAFVFGVILTLACTAFIQDLKAVKDNRDKMIKIGEQIEQKTAEAEEKIRKINEEYKETVEFLDELQEGLHPEVIEKLKKMRK